MRTARCVAEIITSSFLGVRTHVEHSHFLRNEETAIDNPSYTSSLSWPSNSELLFSMVIDNCRIRGEFIDSLPFAVKFPIENIDFIAHPKVDTHGNSVVLLYGQARYEPSEWKCTVQLRIKTGTADKQRGVRVVDKMLVEFGNRITPLTLNISDEEVKRIKFEMKSVNQLYERLPTFQSDGDVVLLFNRGEKLYADKSLLALHSRYMASMLYDAAPNATVDMRPCDRATFIELLYQIYGTSRPVCADLFKLSQAATGYKADAVLARITKFISGLDMDLVDKFQLAVRLKLDNSLSELAYDAEQRGMWADLIQRGFEPESLGIEIYHRIVCPAIIKARQYRLGTSPYSLHSQIHFQMPQPPYTVPLIVAGRILYVNKGILAWHNVSGIAKGAGGQLILRTTEEVMALCAREGITIVDLVLKMLQHIYPSQATVPGPYIRPMMALAEELGMKLLLNSLCEMLALEPAQTAATMLEHFELANRYNNANLLAANLLRIEGSFKEKVGEFIALPEFRQLPDWFQKQILDRHCSGWALNDRRLANVPTTNLNRTISLDWGGPLPTLYDSDISLATFQGMKSNEAFGSPEEFRITDCYLLKK